MATTTSTIGMYSKANMVEENALRGVRRSRFSFHFMTHRTRRWLLVQWVSVPITVNSDKQATNMNLAQIGNRSASSQPILSDFTTQSWLRRVA